jgi:hypothetical protein
VNTSEDEQDSPEMSKFERMLRWMLYSIPVIMILITVLVNVFDRDGDRLLPGKQALYVIYGGFAAAIAVGTVLYILDLLREKDMDDGKDR